MENIVHNNQDLLSYFRFVIEKYCPYTENRLSLLDENIELDINIYINKTMSYVKFDSLKRTITTTSRLDIKEALSISYVISFEELSSLIDYILNDHDVIQYIGINDEKIEMGFDFNLCEKNLKGLYCRTMRLNVNFEDMELKKEYIINLFKKYFNKLKKVESFIRLRDRYVNEIKENYFDSLNKDEMIDYLKKIDENELRNLLYHLNNDVFIDIEMNDSPKEEIIKLLLEQ